jgi:gliding-associated putative ABC transporter substrate-binding component GldG
VKKQRPLSNCVLALLAVNILSCLLFVRLDVTSNRQYSLSPVSKSIIARVNEDISVDLYMSSGLSREERRLGKEFVHLLKEYRGIHRHRFSINVITPNTEEDQLMALERGIELVSRETVDRDMVQLRTILFGATIRVGNRVTVIPRIMPFTPLEYEFTRVLKENRETVKPVIGLVTGHGEIHPNDISLVIGEIYPVAEIESLFMHPRVDLSRYKVICIIGPADSFSPLELDLLEEYVERGGRLFIALNHAVGKAGLTPTYGFINRVGIEEWLEHFGLRIKYDFIVDRNSNVVSITRPPSFLSSFPRRLNFPYAPVIVDFSKHLITENLRAISLEYASSIEAIPSPAGYTFTWLAKSSSMSGVKEIPVVINSLQTTKSHDFNKSKRTVAALLGNEQTGGAIVTITNADFMQDAFYSPTRHDNINFVANAIEWLADDSGLINLRNKYVTRQPVTPVTYLARATLQVINLLLPPLLVGLIALWARQKKRRKRLRRMYSNEL